MNVKASPRAGKVSFEFEPDETALPPIAIPELKLNRILVPVDFSEPSRKALHYAISFAQQFNAKIFLVHVLETFVAPEVVESGLLNTQIRESASGQLTQWQKEAARHTETTIDLRQGSPHWEIVRAADERNINLIIVGTHGRTGLSHLFIGSTAERVVRHAPCPVMVVREREHDFLAEPTAKRKSARK